jgi:hypothetical protein
MIVATLAFLTGCSAHKGVLQPIPPNTDPLVYTDALGKNVDWQPFLNSKYDALAIDNVEKHSGTKSIRITVPGPGDTGGYAGGAFVTSRARDLSGYNALTFWCKASRPVTMAVAGLGNDNTGTSLYDASRSNLTITATWTKYTIPVPLPAKLSHERGMFYFAQAPDNLGGCTLWFDDIQFEVSPDVANPRANPARPVHRPRRRLPARAHGHAGAVRYRRGTESARQHVPNYLHPRLLGHDGREEHQRPHGGRGRRQRHDHREAG